MTIIGQFGGVTNLSSLGGILPVNVIIRGRLIVDLPSVTFINNNIKMDNASEIFVLQNCTLNLDHVSLSGCTQMWKGIYVDGAINTTGPHGRTSIADAENGILVSYLSTASSIVSCDFRSNITDINFPVGQTIGSHLISDNFFAGSTTLAPYSGQLNYRQSSFVSIDLQGCNLVTIDFNRFRRYVAAIRSSRSNFNVSRSDFQFISDVNIVMYYSNAIIDRNQINANSIYNYGIFASQSGFDIRNFNNINNVGQNVRKTLIYAEQSLPFITAPTGNLYSGIDNNFLFNRSTEANSKGVHLWNNANEIAIFQNFITTVNSTNNFSDIELSNTSNAKIARNEISVRHNRSNGRGITLLNSVNNNICGNDIDLTSDFNAALSNIGLLSESGSGSNTIYRNLFFCLDGNQTRNSVGIRNNSSIDLVSCNAFDFLTEGYQLSGSSLNSQITSNIFDHVQKSGMAYAANTITGPQILTGNRWLMGAQLGFGAWHGGSAANVSQSQYLIDLNNTVTAPPAGYTWNASTNVPNWFVPPQILTSTPICERPTNTQLQNIEDRSNSAQALTCEDVVWIVTPTDHGIVAGVVDGSLASSLPAGTFNIAQRQLFHNMTIAGDYMATAEASQLYNVLDQGVIGLFHRAEKQVNGIIEYSPSLKLQIKATNGAIYQKMNEIMSIDTLPQNSVAELARRSQLIQELSPLSITLHDLRQEIQREKVAKALAALEVVNSLPNTELWMQNEKVAYTVYINYILRETKPDEQEHQALRSIALQCIAEGGQGVIFARSMCSGLFNESYVDNCTSGSASNGEANHPNLSIFPNPASDAIRIDLPFPSQLYDQVKIVDINGKEFHTVTLADKASAATVDISRLHAGFYYCSVVLGGKRYTEKFIVIK